MGPLCALGVLLTLLEAGKGQTLKPPPAITPVLQSFQEDQFQGEWFVVGLAGSTYGRADRSFLNSFIATFEQTGNRRLRVSYAMMRGQRCITWSYVLIPQANPGKFSVNNSRLSPASLEEVQVHDTNYTTFALMFSRRQSGSQLIVRVYLLCRMWAFETQVLGRFVCLVRAHGLSEESVVFPDLTDWLPHLGTC
ncbi:lipocalin 12 [Rhinolophus ferrumequinum]|uniref:Lipocalin 12 n=1 Tax=Rhinolophus ferrumequinum TaxID=59479 RepID=A0A7J7VQL4_RHIFE|nr:lipocalin 12 [Rhinolophus ferrumequinum]